MSACQCPLGAPQRHAATRARAFGQISSINFIQILQNFLDIITARAQPLRSPQKDPAEIFDRVGSQLWCSEWQRLHVCGCIYVYVSGFAFLQYDFISFWLIVAAALALALALALAQVSNGKWQLASCKCCNRLLVTFGLPHFLCHFLPLSFGSLQSYGVYVLVRHCNVFALWFLENFSQKIWTIICDFWPQHAPVFLYCNKCFQHLNIVLT